MDPTGKSWYNPLSWTVEGAIESIEAANQAVMDVGDLLTFGRFSAAFEGVQDAADRINEEGFNLDTALNVGEAILGGSFEITGAALAESVIIGKGNILRKQLFGKAAKEYGANKWGDVGITSGEAKRIQNAADKIKKPINVVGSRASGTSNELSDWDYVVNGLNKKLKDKIKNSLPKGKSRGKLNGTKWSGIDLDSGSLIKDKPSVKFIPKKFK